MACPYFDPLEPWPLNEWLGPSRVPLGQPWRGRCAAPGAESDPAGESTQRELCNFGYARGRCSRFPADSDAEAHRFSCVAQRGSSTFEVIWIEERECTPLRHQILKVTCAGPASAAGDGIPFRQARAFALSCARPEAAAALQAHLRKPDL